MENTRVTTLPDGLTVGGSLCLSDGSLGEAKKPVVLPPVIWRDKYIKVDGVFTEIVSHKGNVYRVKEICKNKIFYLVTDGEGRWAHGDTLKKAREALIYKTKDRDTSKYEGLSLETKLTFQEGVEMYHAVTGACSTGMRMFVEETGIPQKPYTIREIIEMTKGCYGYERLVAFFNK